MRHLPIELIVIFSKKHFGKQVGTENVPLQDGG